MWSWWIAIETIGAGRSVTLAWDPNPETNIAGYRMYYSIVGSGKTSRIDRILETTNRVHELSPSATYSFYVTAYNIHDLESDPSNIVYWTVPPEIQALSFDGATRVWWGQGIAGARYLVSRAKGDEATFIPVATIEVPYYLDLDVRINQTNRYIVSILTQFGPSSNSLPVVAHVRTAPVGLTIESNGGIIKLKWAPVAGASAYAIVRAEAIEGPYHPLARNISAVEYTDTAAKSGRSYFYAVATETLGGDLSSYSTPKGVITVPSAPRLGRAELFAATVASLSWSTDEPAIDQFRIQESSDGASFEDAGRIPGGRTSFLIEGLSPGTTNYYRIAAENSAGSSEFSSITKVQVPPFGINISFRGSSALIPGYSVDLGHQYGAREAGLTYGWSQERFGSGVDRGDSISPDSRFDSFIAIRPGDKWEIEIPRGSYQVRVIVGDPQRLVGASQIEIEGIITRPKESLSEGIWVEYSKSIFVLDGRLTIAGSANSEAIPLCFIDLYAAPAEPPAIGVQPFSQSIIEDAELRLAAAVLSGTEPISWQWYLNENRIAGATSPELFISHAQGSNAGRYFVVLSNAVAAVSSSPAEVVVLPVNDPPTLESIPSLLLSSLEDPREIRLRGITSGAPDESQSLTVRATHNNPRIIQSAQVSYNSPSTEGVLRIVPVPQSAGHTVVSVEVNDGVETNSSIVRRFTVTVATNLDSPLVIEAESGVSELPSRSDSSASNGAKIHFSGLAFATAVYPLEVRESGDYFVWCRLSITAPGLDSSLYSLLLADESSTTIEFHPDLTRLGSGGWRWVRVASGFTGAPYFFRWQSGVHSLRLSGSDAPLFLDALMAVRDPNFVPEGGSSNSPPQFAVLSDLAFPQDSGSHIVDLQGISKGSPTENQSLRFSARSSNPILIPHPLISYQDPDETATLTLTASPGLSGTALITVTLDDGGGVNNLAQQMFLVTVMPLNTPPKISAIPNQSINEGRVLAPITFTVGDRETPAQLLQITASSSNEEILLSTDIVIKGEGSSRVIELIPLPYRAGSSFVTLTVVDALGERVESVFTLNVVDLNQPPTIQRISDISIPEDSTSGPIPVVIGDFETSANALLISASSSNTQIIPSSGILLGGAGSERSITIIPVLDRTGSARITVTVRDGSGGVTNTAFNVAVTPVNDAPTFNAVADLVVNVTTNKTLVSLSGISPGVGETQPLSVRAVSRDPGIIPDPLVVYTSPSSRATLEFGPFRRAAERVPIDVTIDDGDPVNGKLKRTFYITVLGRNTPPTISTIPSQTTEEDTLVIVHLVVNDADSPAYRLNVSATSSSSSLVPEAGITLSGSGTNRTLTIQPVRNSFGTTTISVSVSDGLATARSSFQLTVAAINDAPTMDPIADIPLNVTNVPTSKTITLTGISGGPPNEPQLTIVTALSSNTNLVPHPAVLHDPASRTGTLTLNIEPSVIGASVITIMVAEVGNSSSISEKSFKVHVKQPANSVPTISDFEVLLEKDGPPVTVPFVVGDAESRAEDLVVWARSNKPEFIRDSDIVIGGIGSQRTLQVRPVADQSGTAAIMVSVADPDFGLKTIAVPVAIQSSSRPPALCEVTDYRLQEDAKEIAIPIRICESEVRPQDLKISAASSDQSLVADSDIFIGGSGADRILEISPQSNRSGAVWINVTVSDGFLSSVRKFLLTIDEINDLPVIVGLPERLECDEDGLVTADFHVHDVETTDTQLEIVITSSNLELLPHSGIELRRGAASESLPLKLTPLPESAGTSRVTIGVSDGVTTVSQTIKFVVNPVNDAPSIDPIPDISLPQFAQRQTILLTGLGPGRFETNQNLLITASSANPALIPHPSIGPILSNGTAELNFAPLRGARGQIPINVTVSDGQSSNSLTSRVFTVTINAAPRINFNSNLVLSDSSSPWIEQFK